MTDFISVEKVYGILDAAITPISRKERLPLRDALGCVLAESLYATNDVPAFNNSAMDGFAFPGSSLPAHGLARLKASPMPACPIAANTRRELLCAS